MLEQAKNNTTTATFGRKAFAFTRQADGSYTPAAGGTAQLVKDSGSGLYRIDERFGQTLNFDAMKRLASFTDADGKALTLTYETSGLNLGRLKNVSDCYNRTLTFDYYADTARAGLLASVTDSSGRSVGYDYTAGQLTAVTDPETHTRTFEYDSAGRLWKTYDEQDRLVAETLYDANGAVSTQIAEGDAAQTWQYAFTGVLNTETNPLGEVTAYRYDRFGRLVAETDGEGATSTRAYDGQNHLVAVTDALNYTTTFQYDGRHNLRFVTGARNAVTEHRYDAQDHMRYTIDALNKQTEYRYDSEHHLTKTIDPLFRETTIEYYTAGAADGLPWKLIAPNADTTITAYDAYGHPDTITRPDGSMVDVTYNARGDLLDSVTTTSGDSNTHAVSFTYDANRRLLTSADALGFGTTSTFDPAGNLEAIEDRAGNIVSFTFSAGVASRPLPHPAALSRVSATTLLAETPR
ncbi:MAG: RHS repeat protein [Opitutaceae bacterium]|nr:RHS repeat protein [Opitutaceae bacterium]